jgi:hypothetical protein
MNNNLVKLEDDRAIKGSILKFVDGRWSVDGEQLRPNTQLIVLMTTEALQHWQERRPVETIMRTPDKGLPDVEKLNAQIPVKDWEPGLDGNPRPPWQHQYITYLLDENTAEMFTHLNSTVGTRIATQQLEDKITWMRALRGNDVFPVVELADKPMKTKIGQKIRPHFRIVDWRRLGTSDGGGGDVEQKAAPQIEHKPTEPAKPQSNLPAKPRERVGKPVEPVTLQEE